jgi:hypothetical protein
MRAPIRQHAPLLTSVAVSLAACQTGGATGGAAGGVVLGASLVGQSAPSSKPWGQPWAGLFHRRFGPRSQYVVTQPRSSVRVKTRLCIPLLFSHTL